MYILDIYIFIETDGTVPSYHPTTVAMSFQTYNSLIKCNNLFILLPILK